MVKELAPSVTTFHFWSDGCAGQFRSKFVFRSFTYYPKDIYMTWNYGEADHFKGPHDGIGGTVKRKVYREVSSGKVVIENARKFATFAGQVCDIQVLYLDATEVQELELSDSIYTLGTLKVHHVKRVDTETVGLYFNSTFKQDADLLKTLRWQDDESKSDEHEECRENEDAMDENKHEVRGDNETTKDPEEREVCQDNGDVKEGEWVYVFYEGEKFLGKQEEQRGASSLPRKFGIREPQEFERKEDAIYYEKVYKADVNPQLVQKGRKWLWVY